MASSNDSTTGWQIATIVVSFLFLLAAVGAYFGWAEAAKERTNAASAASQAKEAKGTLATQVAGAETVKTLVGHTFDDLDGGPNTVAGSISKDLEQYGGPERQPTVTATMAAMRARIDSLQAENASQQENIARRDERLRNIEAEYENRVQESVAGRKDSETALRDKVRSSEDVLAEKDAELRQVREQFETAQIEKETIRDTLDQFRDETGQTIEQLEKLLAARSAELDKTRDLSFENPDGFVRSVDPIQRTVTIGLGEADGLPVQTTFSVYKRNASKVGRGAEDIKGSIEVTRILGPHQAEARILDQDNFDPISREDMVFSPIWEKGQTEYFAFVGELDIDGDGRDDRQLVERILENQGAKLDFYVNEDAERVPSNGRISERTKFLVVGDIPDLSSIGTQDDRYDKVKQLEETASELRKEALRFGKRVVGLREFLAFVGYKPTQRLYQPGSGRDYNIRDGQRPNSQKRRPLIDTLPKF